ncbi:MAG: leucine-rich repeat protein [Ruminococcus sp.]|nr:leucine-rich repeat protein [Ruminococcus sp.]
MKFIRKSVSVILSLILIISLFTILPPEAFAAAEVQYIERSWDSANQKVVDTVKTCTDYTTITSQSSLTIGSGKWYVVNGDATIDKRVTVSGTAHIILLSGTLKCMYGIRLSKGNSLFVYPGKNSEGKLNPRTGDDEEANLGGNKGEDCGEFVFYGGTLDVFNYDWCSGATAIGGGGYGGNCGKLSFYGGTVDASNNGAAPSRKSYGAVIGDGSEAYSNDSDCYINIYGGAIKADNHAYSNGSGIGGGEDSTGCPINILGGKITARAYNGAGIGSGQDGGSSTVTIKNATVEAESDYGAGIGSGEDSNSKSIIIENSYVKAESKTASGAVGAEGAGIGGGNCGKSESIKISKSIIIASSGRYGAGIGGGDESDGGNIEITDSNVFAHSAQGGAGIGGGDEKGCNSIVLKNSFVTAITDSDVNSAGENFIKDYGSYYNTIMESISNPAISEQAGFYAGGALTAMAIAYLINGNHTGAGIGSGDSGNVDKILIDNCIVMTQAGEYAAGIGGGDEGGFGTINIKNSHIYAEGGKYGAGIGSGDEAEKCGTINITNSNVTAKAGTDAAGIGTGNETDQSAAINITGSTVEAHGGRYAAGIGGGDAVGGGTINIINSTITEAKSETDGAGIGGGESGNGGTINITGSTVTAHGGGYAAGIGGGDHADGGTTTIDNSTVKAYGGTDAAGIGGGEDGDGGHVEIINGSNVYAEGKDYGAGIGGGEDASGDYCQINNSCTVKAVSGGDGNVQSIGHGDCGWYVSSYTGGELSLGNREIVKVGSDVYRGNDRFSAIWNHKEVTVSPCEHTNTEWRMVNEYRHCKYCKDCDAELTSTKEYHKWDDNNICTVCGGEQIDVSLTLKEENNSGPVNITIQNKLNGYYVLPECVNIPDGKVFAYWYDEIDGTDYYPGESYRLVYRNNNLRAVYFDLTDADYIDENGHEQTVKARVLNKGEGYLYLSDGWYIVTEDIGVGWMLYICGDVHLILADGKTLYLNEKIPGLGVGMRGRKTDNSYSKLTIYGQNNQTGAFNLQDRRNSLTAFSQYGGNVSGAKMGDTAKMSRKYYTITKGSFNLDARFSAAPDGIINFTGGNIYIKDVWMEEGVTLTLGWTHRTDSIKLDKIDYYKNASVKVADGQALTDGTNVYSGTLTDNQLNAINGKTLTPYIHNYSEPEWVWDSDYTNATAVFRCSDCDDVQEIKAKVTYTDSGKTRTSTARCSFLGVEYTTTQTKQIIFDVKIANTAHGTVTANKATAKKDENIKLTITPDDGYITKGFTVVPEDGTQEIEMDEKYFTMPACNVTVKANFAPITPRTEPYIDDEGEYHLGNVAYYEEDGKYYAVDEDGTIGEYLDSIELSYFDFALINNDSEYQIKYYTGPYDNLTELVIPKTYNSKPITSLGTDNEDRFMQGSGEKPQFSLVLNENITEIKQYSFYTQDVKEVKGNTSRLKTIGNYAFSWGNSPDNFNIDVKLDYEGTITCGSYIFNHRNTTLRLKHSTRLNKTSLYDLGAQSVNYVFTDAHTYGEPEWKWADDYSSAKAALTCTDTRCKHTEKADATVTKADELTKTTYTATVEFENETYTDTQTVNKTLSNVTVNSSNHGTVATDKVQAYEGEEITLTIAPDTGYKLTELTVKDSSNKELEVKNNKFTMPKSDITVSATFAAKQYAISYSDYDDIWLSGPLYANTGEEVTVFAHPHSGYEITKLTYRDGAGDYHNIDIDSKTFTMPASEIKIYATFRKANYTITYETDGHGTVTGAATAQFNDRVPITVTPNEGYVLNNLYAEDDEWGDPADIIDGCIVMYDGAITVRAEFTEITPAKEPYIDKNGEYHLGNIEYVQLGDDYYTVENGAVGSRIDSVELSYFDYTDNGSTYQINYYTGPTDNLTELVIPKTYNGKPITVLGTDNQNAFIANSNPKPQFTLTLNENIQVIKGYAFYTMWVKKVQGDTSNLSKLGDYAFSWANSPNGYTLDIKLDYEGIVSAGRGVFNNMTVTARLKHATAFNRSNFMQKSITYVITDDAHSYGNPVWTWADDYSSASAKFTCTDPHCKHEETADAAITSEYENGAPKYTATALFENKTYTDVNALSNLLDASYYPGINAMDALRLDKNLFALPGELVYTKAKLLGVQKKETIKTDTAGTGLRFVAELSSEYVNKENVDYGFEIVKTSKNNTAEFNTGGGFGIMQNLINTHSDNIKSISCKNTDNNIVSDYGNRSTDTTYKYVTLAINNIDADQGIAVRFYVEIDGVRYYSSYTNSTGDTFRGCCASCETLVNAVG